MPRFPSWWVLLGNWCEGKGCCYFPGLGSCRVVFYVRRNQNRSIRSIYGWPNFWGNESADATHCIGIPTALVVFTGGGWLLMRPWMALVSPNFSVPQGWVYDTDFRTFGRRISYYSRMFAIGDWACCLTLALSFWKSLCEGNLNPWRVESFGFSLRCRGSGFPRQFYPVPCFSVGYALPGWADIPSRSLCW